MLSNDITRLGTARWIPEESAESLFSSNREEEGRAFPETGGWQIITQRRCFVIVTVVGKW